MSDGRGRPLGVVYRTVGRPIPRLAAGDRRAEDPTGMLETYTCPQCGTPVGLPRYAPGVKLHCPECSTLIELPYLTRRVKPRRRRPLPGWAGVVLTAGLAVVLAFLTYETVKGRMREERRKTLTQILLLVDDDEAQGRLDAAVRRLDAALQLAAEPRLTSADQVQALRDRRDRLAAEHTERSEKQAIDSAEADLVVAGTLPTRLVTDLPPLFDLCERVLRTVQPLRSPRALAARQKAENLAGRAIEQRGILIDPPRGAFAFDPDTVFHKLGLEDALRGFLFARGYIPRRENSLLTSLWDRSAPFRLTIELNESRYGKYMNSVLDTFQIDAALELKRGSTTLWKNRVDGRTRQPSPRIPARLSGILAVRMTKDPELERQFFDDAAAHLLEQLPARLTALPLWSFDLLPSPGRSG